MGFFAGKFADVGKALDEARFALISENGAGPNEAWAASLSVIPESRLVDTASKSLSLELISFYKTTTSPPKGASCDISLINRRSRAGFLRRTHISITSLPLKLTLPTSVSGEGDFLVSADILIDGKLLSHTESTISFVTHLEKRLEALRQLKPDPGTTERSTLQANIKLLTSLAKNQTLETDYPAEQILRQTELSIDNKADYNLRKPGQFWLTLVNGKTSAPARLMVPMGAEAGRPLPLLVALHGAGGSENMFFDGYGRGKTVEMCEKRGWMLVAPGAVGGFNHAPVGDVIDAVAKLYPVDRKRVFLIGHSMGAMQGLSMVQKQPQLFAGFAAISGGGAITPTEALKALPFFVGVGAEDFAVGMSRQANSALKKAEVKSIVFKEYPACEHLFAVQVALPDVFEFFDRILNFKNKAL